MKTAGHSPSAETELCPLRWACLVGQPQASCVLSVNILLVSGDNGLLLGDNTVNTAQTLGCAAGMSLHINKSAGSQGGNKSGM